MLSPWTRALAVGVAAGSRSTLGATAPLLLGRRVPLLVLRGVAVAAELAGDQLPRTPSRLDGPGPAFRGIAGAIGGVTVVVGARRAGDDLHGGHVAFGALLGAAASVAGTYGGAAWRRLFADKGLPDWPAAITEDAAALALAAVALRSAA